MQITRREFGAIASAALILRGMAAARAGEPDVFVGGWNMPANLDPHQVMDVGMLLYALNAYDNLYRYEGSPPQMQPWLAESYTVSGDHLVWQFKLRHGVKFHDGSELTAADVVYSFHRVLGIGKAPASVFLPILKAENVTAPDPYTVSFKLDKPYGPFFSAIPTVFIVNKALVEAHAKDGDWAAGWVASNDAGSGAYKLDPKTYVPMQQADIDINPAHFRGWSDNPKPIKQLEYRPTAVTSTRVLALLNGSLDMTDSYLPVDQVERIDKSSTAHVAKNLSMRLFLVRMNNTKPPFDNINARKCFAHAFNYAGFIGEILHGEAKRDPAPLPNNLWGYPKGIVGYEYDMEKAKQYFDKAVAEGAPMKKPIEMHVQQQLEQTVQAGQMFQADLATLGINLKLVNDTFANLTTASGKAETTPPMWIHWISTYFVDPENWVGQMYDSRFHGTWKASCWYKNDKVDALLTRARGLIDQEERAPLYEEAIRLVVADSPDIWIYNMIELCGISNRVKGFRFCPVGSGGEMRWMHLSA